jgi:hypothetical protein
MQNSPEFVQHCIIIGREGAFHDEPSSEDVFSRPEAAPGDAADFSLSTHEEPRSSDCWDHPAERPSFNEVTQSLSRLGRAYGRHGATSPELPDGGAP